MHLCVCVGVFCGHTNLNTTTWSIRIDISFQLVNHPRSTAAIQQQEKQRYYTSEHHVKLIFVRSIRTAVFPLFSLRHPSVSCQQHPEGGHPRPKHKQDVAVKSPNNPSFFPIPQLKPNLDMRWPEQIFLTPMTKHSKLGMIIGLPTLLAHRPYSGLGSTFERTSKRTRCRYNGGLYLGSTMLWKKGADF